MNNLAVLLFFAVTAMANYQGGRSSSPPVGDNIFLSINTFLQDAAKKIFTYLNKDKFFNQTERLKLLYKMHENLKTVAENNFKFYQDIENAMKIGADNKTINPLFNITALVDKEIESRYYVFDPNKTVLKNENYTKKEHLDKAISSKYSTLNTTFDNFIKKFLKKIDTSLQINKNKLEGKNFSNQRINRKTLNDLEVWVNRNSEEVIFENNGRRVFNGKPASINRYPFVVSLHILGDFMCAGSIISKTAVITAASCMLLAFPDREFQTEVVELRVGSNYTKKHGELIPIVDIFFHPNYDTVYMKHNLAIVRIETQYKFNRNKQLKRILYDRVPVKLPKNRDIEMLGWGEKDNNSMHNGPILLGRLEVYKLGTCKEIYSQNYVNDDNFCAGFVWLGSGACSRDIGGPGIQGSKLVGVVSFGPPTCGTPDAPTVFTKLGHYTDWIEIVLKNMTAATRKRPINPNPMRQLPQLTKATERHQKVTTTKYKQESSKTTKQFFHKYPEEVKILTKLFKDLLVSGNINVNKLLDKEDALKEEALKEEALKEKLENSVSHSSKKTLRTREKSRVPYTPTLPRTTTKSKTKKTTKTEEVPVPEYDALENQLNESLNEDIPLNEETPLNENVPLNEGVRDHLGDSGSETLKEENEVNDGNDDEDVTSQHQALRMEKTTKMRPKPRSTTSRTKKRPTTEKKQTKRKKVVLIGDGEMKFDNTINKVPAITDVDMDFSQYDYLSLDKGVHDVSSGFHEEYDDAFNEVMRNSQRRSIFEYINI